jgi:hypothetical protein
VCVGGWVFVFVLSRRRRHAILFLVWFFLSGKVECVHSRLTLLGTHT